MKRGDADLTIYQSELKKLEDLKFKFHGDEGRVKEWIASKFNSPDLNTLTCAGSAVDGSEVSISFDEGKNHLRINSDHPESSAQRMIVIDETAICKNMGSSNSPLSPIRGAEILLNQIIALRKMGVKKITTTTAGNYRLTNDSNIKTSGYYTWVQLGFDGAIPDQFFDSVSDEIGIEKAVELLDRLKNNRTLQSLFSLEDGSDLWYKYGGATNLEFDLSDNSVSMIALSRYLNHERNSQ